MDNAPPELMAERVTQAREGLASRLSALERRVVGVVDTATESVSQTAAAVRETVTGVASDVRGLYQSTATGVRELLDIPGHVRAHPWPGVGLAVFAGFLTGFLPSRRASRPQTFRGGEPAAPSVWGNLLDLLRREVVEIGESAIMAAGQSLKQNVQAFAEQLPRTLAASYAGNGYREQAHERG